MAFSHMNLVFILLQSLAGLIIESISFLLFSTELNLVREKEENTIGTTVYLNDLQKMFFS